MKKKFTAVIASMLALLLLCAGASPEVLIERGSSQLTAEEPVMEPAEGEVRFADMVYERPDMERFRACADRLIQTLNDQGGYRRTVELLDEIFTLYRRADTAYTLADIHNCLDLTDEAWAEEYAACMSAITEVNQIMEDVYLACGASPYGARLEREFFGEGFMAEYGEDAESMLSEEYVALLEAENELLMEYRNLMAEPTVTLDGAERPYYETLYNVESAEEADAVYHAYYEKYNPLLGELYLRLIEVRKAQAASLGYDSYGEMMYDIGFDRDYSVEDGQKFIESVKRYVLPVYTRHMDAQRQAELMEDFVSEEELYRVLAAVAEGLGGEVKQAHDFMLRNGLSDLKMSDLKANMSFQTYISDYEAPFLFANPYGDMDDMITVTHEFGHFAEAYISYGSYRSTDLAEVFSQTMQLLSLGQLDDVLGTEGVERLRLLNLCNILDTVVWQTAWAEFEARVYALPEPSLEQINAIMAEVVDAYGLNPEGDPDYACAWVDVPHFFEQPFYVISYPVSACCALEIYERELESGTGLSDYLRLVESEEIGILAAVEEAGLQNPITEARVREIAAFLEDQF